MRHTVLVVDDDPGVVKFVGTLLERGGYTVIPAVGPHEALTAFTNAPDSISLVLADVVMPQIDGLELVKRMREKRPDLPYILMTGFSTEALMQYLIDVEGGPLLRKPFTSEALLARIRKVLG